MPLSVKDTAQAAYWIKKGRAEPYKAAFWRLALSLGRLPTTRDPGFWELPQKEAGRP